MATNNTTPAVFTEVFNGNYAEFKQSKSLPSINWVETKSPNSYFAIIEGVYYFIATELLERLQNDTKFCIYSIDNGEGNARLLCFDQEYKTRKVRTI